MVNMSLLRKTAAEKAMTGAILRVIRALVGMKGQYTKAELAKPFAVTRVTFSPDYNDPEVRRAMLEQGMNSMTNMFGSHAMLAAPVSEADYAADPDIFDPEDFAGNPAFVSDVSEVADDYSHESYDPEPEPEHAAPPKAPHTDSGGALECGNCGNGISATVSEFSTKKFGLPLCMKCQKEATP
jgi:hypothetical protein